MAVNEKPNGLEKSMDKSIPNGPAGMRAGGADRYGDSPPSSRWVVLALQHRRLLLISSVCGLAFIFIMTEFVIHPKYQAQAVLRPIGDVTGGGLAGMLGSSTGLSLTNPTEGDSTPSHDPNELTEILESYAFTTSMIKDEHLASKLTKGSHHLWPFSHGQSSLYDLYLLMSSRFDDNYSMRTGNLSVSYIDKNPELATIILGLYIDRLPASFGSMTFATAAPPLKHFKARRPRPSIPCCATTLTI